MTNQEYSFIEGFVKRASEYGYDELEAIEMLKSAETIGPIDAMEAAGVAGNDARLRAMEHNKKHHPGHYYLNPIVSGPITKLIHKGLNRTYGNEEKQNKHRANFEKLLKSATAADAPALQVPPTFAQGLNNVKGNLLNAASNPRNINPVNAPIMTGSAGTPAPGLQGIPAMAKNLYSNISPVEGRPTFKGMNGAANKTLNNMAEGLWTTPPSKPSTVPAPQPVTPAMRNESIMQPGQKAYNQDPRTGRALTPEELEATNY